MAKTTIQGTGGAATITGFGAKLDLWSATMDFGVVDTTGFGDAGWGVVQGTLCGVTGSASGMVEDDAAPMLAAMVAAIFDPASAKIATMLLYTTGTTGWSFPAIVSNVSLDRPEVDKMTVSFDFVSNGRITPT